MILANGTTVTGLFIYSNSSIYTYSDIVVYNTKIYLCITNDPNGVVGEVPDQSANFVDYSNRNSVTSVDDYNSNSDPNKLVPAFLMKSIINSYMGGLKGNRELETLSGFDLNNISTSYKAFVKRDCLNLPLDMNNAPYYILNCYANSPASVTTNPGQFRSQELIDFITPNIFTRIYDTEANEWGPWASLVPTSDVITANAFIQATQVKVDALMNALLDYTNNSTNYYKLKLERQGTLATSVTVTPNVNQVGMWYVEVSNNLAKRVLIFSNFNEQKVENYFTLNFNANTGTFTINTNVGVTPIWGISRVYSSKFY